MNNRVYNLVDNLYKNNCIDKIEEELLQLRSEALTEEEQRSWYFEFAAAALHRGDRPAAFQRFSEAATRYPNDLEIQFVLGQEHEYRGEIEHMLNCFNKAQFPAVPAIYALNELRYAYLWNKFDDGLRFIEPIFKDYFELEIIDDTFLDIRGLPSFSVTWGCYAALGYLKKDLTLLIEKFNSCKRHLKEYDFLSLELDLEAIINDDFSKTIEYGKKVIRKNYGDKFIFSDIKLKNIILESRMAIDYSSALSLFDRINFKLEWPWLRNVITLAKAELANKYNDEEEEKKLLNIFLQNQPLLLEPNNALYFNLLDYQEQIKTIYQNSRTNAATAR